ncbi:MAG: hypothetical protein U0987_04785, partial [Afipia sp.]|nr:hypothetical protein [Afipia sp.]
TVGAITCCRDSLHGQLTRVVSALDVMRGKSIGCSRPNLSTATGSRALRIDNNHVKMDESLWSLPEADEQKKHRYGSGENAA